MLSGQDDLSWPRSFFFIVWSLYKNCVIHFVPLRPMVWEGFKIGFTKFASMSPIILPYYHVVTALLRKKLIVLLTFSSHEILAFKMSNPPRRESKFSSKNEIKSKINIFWLIKTTKKCVGMDNLTRSNLRKFAHQHDISWWNTFKNINQEKFTSGKNMR